MQVFEIAEAFAALGNPLRLRIIRSLLDAGPIGQTLTENSLSTGRPVSTVAFHIRLLCHAGVVKAVPGEGRVVRYRVDGECVAALAGYLAYVPPQQSQPAPANSPPPDRRTVLGEQAIEEVPELTDAKPLHSEAMAALVADLPKEIRQRHVKLASLRVQLEDAGYESGIACGLRAMLDGMDVKAAADQAHVRWSRLQRAYIQDGWEAKVKAVTEA